MTDFNTYMKEQLGENADLLKKGQDENLGHDADKIEELNQIKTSDATKPELEDEASKLASVAESTLLDVVYTDQQYFEMLDPDTGRRYDIPMISPVMEGYRHAYISAMRLRVTDPKTYNKIYLLNG